MAWWNAPQFPAADVFQGDQVFPPAPCRSAARARVPRAFASASPTAPQSRLVVVRGLPLSGDELVRSFFGAAFRRRVLAESAVRRPMAPELSQARRLALQNCLHVGNRLRVRGLQPPRAALILRQLFFSIQASCPGAAARNAHPKPEMSRQAEKTISRPRSFLRCVAV